MSTRNFVRKNGPIILFALMTLIGAVIIWFGKLYGVDTVTITLIPLAMMATYFLISFFAAGLTLHNEQAGDNLYYMGFLFTLTSLGVSLYQFSGEASIESVVRNFGVAISSTIAGISLRILFNQMRRDPVDIERAVRHDLAEMTRRVRTELDSSAMEFSTYRRTSHQMLLEGFDEIAKQAEKSGDAVRASIESMSLQATKTIQEAADKLTATLNMTHQQIIEFAALNAKSVSEMSEKLNASVATVHEGTTKLGQAVDDVVERLKSSKSPDELFTEQVAPVVTSLRAIIEEQSKVANETAAANRDVTKKVLTAITPFKQTNATLTALAAKLENVNASAIGSTDAIKSMLERWETISANTQSVAEASTALVSDIKNHSAVSHDASKAQVEATSKLSESLTSLANQSASIATISTNVKDLGVASTRQSALLENVLATVKASTAPTDANDDQGSARDSGVISRINIEGIPTATTLPSPGEAEKVKKGWFR
jgi:hypothetical protein